MVTVVKLRVATIADENRLDRLLAASYRQLLKPHYEPAILSAALPYMIKSNPSLLESGTFFLVENDETIAGCGGWTPEEPGTGTYTPGIGHIRHFATHPDFTGRGVARQIAERCVEEAKASGFQSLCAFSTTAAVGFYESLGFVRSRDIIVTFAGDTPLPSIEMIRTVSG